MYTRSIGIGAALLVAAGLGYALWFHPAGGPAQTAIVAQAGTVPAPPPGSEVTISSDAVPLELSAIGKRSPPPNGYIEYRDDAYSFSFYHAPEARVQVYDEGGGAETVVLESFDKMRGFQVFVVPYGESTISEARFKKDEPSGMRENVENTTLGGVAAVTFSSRDQVLGDTREIWAIHNGYLYEITTFAGVGQWFVPIIESWKFL